MEKKNNTLPSDLHLKGNPYMVPEGYFETFSDRLMQRIDQEELPKKKSEGIIRYLRPVLAMAASFAIIFFMVYAPVRMFSTKQAPLQAEQYYNGLSEIISFYKVNDLAIIHAFENDETIEYDDVFIESVLLASMSEYDLLNLNN